MSTGTADGSSEAHTETSLREIVVCSLEPWDEIWRRNQFLVDRLLSSNPGLRVLFIEPPADPIFDVVSRRAPSLPRLRRLDADGRLRAFRPLKALPRRLGPAVDRLLLDQVVFAARTWKFERPLLWINDVTYAPLIARTGWPSVYDVTDDWLLAPFPPRELARLRRLDAFAVSRSDEVVVCSQSLLSSRSAGRSLSLVPNAVDAEHFRHPRPRPVDLPGTPTAVYAGSLHDGRLDTELVAELAGADSRLNVVLVGPDSLGRESKRRLAAYPNVVLLGARPYAQVPAYLQHADVIVVPHRVTPFTESLDPIKAYECLAVGRPTVATPVAGFRELSDHISVVARKQFVRTVQELIEEPGRQTREVSIPSWEDRARTFERILCRALATRSA